MRRICLILLTLLLPAITFAQGFVEGRDYQEVLIDGRVRPGVQSKVEVVTVFYYGCPHCYRLDKALQEWRETGFPASAYEISMPAVTINWKAFAEAYYAMERLGIADTMHAKIFDHIHKEKVKLRSREDIITYISKESSTPPDKIEKAMESSYVKARLRRAKFLQDGWDLTSVPTVIVDGRYSILNPATDPERTEAIIEYLVEKVLSERKERAPG